MWATASGEPLLTLLHSLCDGEVVYGCAFSTDPEGRHFASSGGDHRAVLWDSLSGSELVSYLCPTDLVLLGRG